MLHFSTTTRKASGEKVSKYMENPIFADDENIPLVTHDDVDYNDYNTPNTSRVDEATCTTPR